MESSTNSVFHLFPCLPTELRLLIWNYSLPDVTTPGTLFYRPLGDHENVTLLVEIPLPHAFVNREARQIALLLAQESGLTRISRKGTGEPIYVRRFKPEHDVLYLSYEMADQFQADFERIDKFFNDSDAEDENEELPSHLVDISCFRYFAVPAELAYQKPHILARTIVSGYPQLTVYVVFNAPPGKGEGEGEGKSAIARPWEFRSIEGQQPVQVRLFSHRFEESRYKPRDIPMDEEDVKNFLAVVARDTKFELGQMEGYDLEDVEELVDGAFKPAIALRR